MKRIMLFALALLSLVPVMAVPAYTGVTRVQQPDGSYVSLRLHGDEYRSFTTTEDGYTVVKASNGFYVYADRNEKGRLTPTVQVAHEASARDVRENTFLADRQKMLAPVVSPRTDSLRQEQRAQRARRLAQCKASAVATLGSAGSYASQYDYSNFRGLILLVEYNDCSFKYSNYRTLMDEMANKENYRGNSYTNVTPSQGVCTGSIRDYYSDCSVGQFVPQFDVVGPIKLDHSMYGEKWSDMQDSGDYSSLVTLMADVVDAADPEVDFSRYDGDGDGVVDLVYIIFAGMGSNFGGNDERLMWPHQSDFYNLDGNPWFIMKDGKRLGHYACSTELYGTKQWNCLEGIGTITHEFGHVLGLPDFYDSDYEDSGGQSIHPGEWSVMAGGGYLNYSRTPAEYTLFERYALGWATPTVIDGEGTYTLKGLNESNTGYRLNTRVRKEFFLFENRQQVKWNKYLPGHGMLVFRIDSTSSQVWYSNKVNANPKHNYFELVRAGGKPDAYHSYEQGSDPFPGSLVVRRLDNTSTPGNLKTWSGMESPYGLRNITESQGVIRFEVIDVNILKSISMEKSITMKTGTFYQLTVVRTPDYAPYDFTWTSSDESVCTVDDNGRVTATGFGQATITVRDNGVNHCTATCKVTVEDADIAMSIAELRNMTNNTETVLKLNDAKVLLTFMGDIFIRDNTGHIVLAGTPFTHVNTNDVLNGSIYGRFTMTEKMGLLQAVSGTSPNTFSVEGGGEAEPKLMYLAEMTDDDYGELVTLKAAKLEKVTGQSGYYVIEDGNMVKVYNTFGLKINSAIMKDTNKLYDITGIIVTRNEGGSAHSEIGMTRDPVVSSYQPYIESAISDLEHDATDRDCIYNLQGSSKFKDYNSQLKRGLYIVRRNGKTYKVIMGK